MDAVLALAGPATSAAAAVALGLAFLALGAGELAVFSAINAVFAVGAASDYRLALAAWRGSLTGAGRTCQDQLT